MRSRASLQGILPFASLLLSLVGPLAGRVNAATFTNFESHQIHPLALSADGSRLFACNTPDNRLTVYTVTAGGLTLEAEIPVGLEPVSVRIRSASEVWVVNHLSDTISIVDLTTMNVRATLPVGDEPTDVVFAGPGGLAWVCVSQEDAIKRFDPARLDLPPLVIPVPGSDPRALAVNSEGTRVYLAAFESGNRTSILSESEVLSGGGPPPPSPPKSPALPAAPRSGLIVFHDGTHWVDASGTRHWDTLVPIPYLPADQDLFEFDALAATPVPRGFGNIGTLNFGLTVHPLSGVVYVANFEAFNLTRFEPNLKGRFGQYRITRVDPTGPGTVTAVHLNPHINYAVSPGPPGEIALSLSQPNAGDWNAAGDRLYLAVLGSGKLAVLDVAGGVLARLDVGEGPSAAEVDDARNRVYVLNRFSNSVALVSTTSLTKTGEVSLGYQPEPSVVTNGRKFLYDARVTSAHGDLACASCHPFAHFDNIAWDLGDPTGVMQPAPQAGIPPFHPMKGPMATQTLRGLAAIGLMHWRGDRQGFLSFNPAFKTLLGRADSLTSFQMQLFSDFILTVTDPPNPNQNLDRTYPDPAFPTPSPERGRLEFTMVPHDGGVMCQTCHQSIPANDPVRVAPGSFDALIPGPALLEGQAFKIPHLRNMYEKTGFADAPGPQKRTFGFIHDGSVDNLFRFLQSPVFTFSNDDERRDLEAFLLAFDTGTAPAVGAQQTVDAVNRDEPGAVNRIALLMARADAGDVDLVVKGRRAGQPRGWLYQAGQFQSDRMFDPPVSATILRSWAAAGGELTFTAVSPGNGDRIGIDRDCDGWGDRDELDAGTNPADASSFPAASAAVEGGSGGGVLATLSRPGSNPMPATGTTVAFTLAEAADVSVRIFDSQGRFVADLLPRSRQQGTVTLRWFGRDATGSDAPSGVYFLRLDARGAGGRVVTRSERIVLAR